MGQLFLIPDRVVNYLKSLDLPPLIYDKLTKDIMTDKISGLYSYIPDLCPIGVAIHEDMNLGSKLPVIALLFDSTQNNAVDYIVINRIDFFKIVFYPKIKIDQRHCVITEDKDIKDINEVIGGSFNGRNYTGDLLFD